MKNLTQKRPTKGIATLISMLMFVCLGLFIVSMWIFNFGICFEFHHLDGHPHWAQWVRTHRGALSVFEYYGSGEPRATKVRFFGLSIFGFDGSTNFDNANKPAATGYSLSYAYPLALCLLIAYLCLRRFLRLNRLVPGFCPQCHYDLRAHHPGQKCPECGRPITSL